MPVIADETARLTVAYNVRRLLNERGWNQATLAKEAGESQMNVSRVVRGVMTPGAGVIARLAFGFEVGVDDLFRPIPK